ncbi:hypothetical protein V8D89_002091 [Ganoderma adspersum]
MFIKYCASSVLLTALCVCHVSAAIVSLYLPPDLAGNVPYTADPIGVDKNRHTTWRYGVGAASGTFTATSPGLPETSATLVEGATDFRAVGVDGLNSVGVDCAIATSTASGGAVVASCVDQIVIAVATTSGFTQSAVTLTPIPVQVPDNFKSSGAGMLRMSLGGVVVSALAVLGTAGMMLAQV